MAADLPENYARYPDAFQLIADVPTDWAESIAIAGEAGDYVVLARRKRGGGDWYLGAIGDEQQRVINVPLDFLVEDQDYVATIYRDGEEADWQTNPLDYVIEEKELDHATVLELRLAAGGGTAIRFRPEEKAKQNE